jgi:hypothetical protein
MPAAYRRYFLSPIQSYAALVGIFDRVQELPHADELSKLNYLIIRSKSDSLVSYDGIGKWLSRNALEWRVKDVSPHPGCLLTFNHLLLDERGLGEEAWGQLISLFKEYFAE